MAASIQGGEREGSVKQKMEIRINLEHEYCDTNADLLFLQIMTPKNGPNLCKDSMQYFAFARGWGVFLRRFSFSVTNYRDCI